MNWKFWKRPPRPNLNKNFPPKRRRIVILYDALIVAIFGSSWLFGSLFGVAITAGTILKAILVVGAVWYSYSESNKAGKKRAGRQNFTDSGHLVNTQASSEPLPIVYGTVRVGANRVYIHTTGPANEYLHIIYTFSEGVVKGVKTDGLGDRIFLDGQRIQAYTEMSGFSPSLAYWKFYKGTGDQTVCAALQSLDPNWDDAMRWTSYLYLRLLYRSDQFSHLPDVTLELEGRELYDPRNGQTVHSDNAALVCFDYLTNDRYSLGIPSSLINADSVKDVANWADANGYKFNGMVSGRKPFIDNLDDILRNFRAGIIWSEGEYKMFVYEYDTPVMTLTEDDIVANSFSINVPGIPETPNRVLVTYPDVVDNYITKTRIIEDPDAVLLYDLEERDFELELIGTIHASQALRLGKYYLERNRFNRQHSFNAHPRVLALEPMDMIQITHSLPGWTEKIVRVLDMELRQDGLVQLSVIEEYPELYDDIINTTIHAYFQTNLPNPLACLSEVQNVEIQEELYGTKNNILTRLKVSFSLGPDWGRFDHAEIWISKDNINYSIYRNTGGTYCEIDSVDENIPYWIKIVPVTNMGVKRPFDLVTAHYRFVFGKTVKPSDVTEFWADASIGGIRFNWTPVDDIDLDYYEIRWAPASDATWDEAIEIAKSYATSKSFPAAKNGKYFIKAIDTTGNESINAISVITEIPTILDWNVQEQLVEDPLFEGIKTDMFVDGGILCLGSAGSFDSDDMFDGDLDFDWGEYGVIGVGYYETDAVNLGTIQSSRCGLSFEFEGINWSERWDGDELVDSDEMVDGEANMVGIIPQIALSQDGVAWGDWVNFFVGDYIAQALKFRIKAFSNHPNQYIAIEALGFDVDMPDRIESGQDAVIPACGTTIDFLKPYMVKPKIGLTLQSANAGDYYYLSAVDENGFTIQIKNSGGVGIEKTIDWESRGY